MKNSRLALRVSLHSAVMILAVYFVMQILAYLRDNVILGVSDLSALPAFVASFIGMYVLPPMVIFIVILYLSALPLQKVLSRLEAGEVLDDELAERTRLRMLNFSHLVLILNLLGFALGFVIITVLQDGIAGLATPVRLTILVSNLSGAVVYASAQSALNNLAFADLREGLAVHAIGTRKREIRGTTRQALLTLALTLYVLTFMQFNMRDFAACRDFEAEALRSVASGEVDEAEAGRTFRERVMVIMPGLNSRPGFDLSSIPLPWEREATREDMQLRIFLLNFLFMLAIAYGVQAANSRETRDQLEAMRSRIGDVVEGDGDLRKRLNLRAMDEFGELAELVNRLLDRFRDVVGRISLAAVQTRDGASSIDRMLADAEGVSSSTGQAVLDLTSSLDAQAAESRNLTEALASFRAASDAVASAVEAQRRFAADTAAAMEEMSANIRSVETMTSRSGTLTEELSVRGESGSAAVTDTGAAIAAIEASAADVLKVLGSLSKIAGDTNLLAMNAAIEAAHAGEQGAGFAVVADEVRNLATNAARQTKAIRDLVAAMSDRVKRGVERSQASGAVLASLSGGIGQAASISREIAEAMREQAAGTKSVEDSLVQVVAASDSIRTRMDEQRRETDLMAAGLDAALRRLSDLASSSRAQADSVHALDSSFAAVRREVDRNLAAVDGLDRELSGFKV